jgi:hypothetical protein
MQKIILNGIAHFRILIIITDFKMNIIIIDIQNHKDIKKLQNKIHPPYSNGGACRH